MDAPSIVVAARSGTLANEIREAISADEACTCVVSVDDLPLVGKERAHVVVVEATGSEERIEDLVSRARGGEVRTAVILVGPKAPPEVAVAALRAGAQDYVFLPLDPGALRDCVQQATRSRTTLARILELSDEVHEANRALKRQAALLADRNRRIATRNRELLLIQEVSQEMARTLDVRQLVRKLHEGLARIVPVEWTCAAVERGERPLRMSVAGPAPDDAATVAETALHAGRALLAAPVRPDEVDLERIATPRRRIGVSERPDDGPTRTVVRPIGTEEHRAGFLVFAYRESRDADGSVPIVTTLANAAALALSNASRYQDALERSRRDALTGLHNRQVLEEALDRETRRAHRHGHPLSVVLFDVDRFKSINDHFGHPMGDEVLRRVAAALRDTVRRTDFVCRIGGDEFAVLLPDTPAEDARILAERIRRAVSAAPPGGGRIVTVCAGFGGFLGGRTPPRTSCEGRTKRFTARSEPAGTGR